MTAKFSSTNGFVLPNEGFFKTLSFRPLLVDVSSGRKTSSNPDSFASMRPLRCSNRLGFPGHVESEQVTRQWGLQFSPSRAASVRDQITDGVFRRAAC